MNAILKKNTSFWVSLVSTFLLAIITILTSTLLHNTRRQSISPAAPNESQAASLCNLSYSIIGTPTPIGPIGPAGQNGLQCFNSNPGSVTFSWTAVPNATSYYLRIDDTANSWLANCGSTSPPNPGDYCIPNITGTSYTVSLPVNKNYKWFVSAFVGSNQGLGSEWVSFGTPGICPPTTNTPTPTSPVSACVNWGNDETSGTDSQLVNFNSALTTATLVKTYLCSQGVCDFEAWDSHPLTNVLYGVAGSNTSLYTINTKSTDSIADGTLTKIGVLAPAVKISALSFRKSDNTLWGWRKGYGLYTINIVSGSATLVYSSTLDEVNGLAWDNNSQYLYLSRTPLKTPINATYELRRYDPVAKTITFYSALPGVTDALDFAPAGYLNGYLMGNYKISGGVRFYTYDIATKTVKSTYNITTGYRNIDAFAACVPTN